MNSQSAFHDRFTILFDRGKPFVVATIVDAHGSVPQDTLSKMIVSDAGLDWGTVGGGRLEAKTLTEAARMLAENLPTLFVDWSLKADVGMTCGGRVKIFFELFHTSPWSIAIFGAGHVAQAVAKILVTLPCQITCIDPRRDWLDKLPKEVERIETSDPAILVDNLPASTSILCMTRGHQSDYPILHRIFTYGREFRFVGAIGSQAKSAVLRQQLVASGVSEERIRFQCPVGLAIGSNHPGEIAVSIVAQLLQSRDCAETLYQKVSKP